MLSLGPGNPLYQRSFVVGAYLAMAWSMARSQSLPPAVSRSLSNSVILQGGNHAATMQRLRVSRQYSLASVRSNPQVSNGDAHLDFTPLFNNPRALINVAQRLHSLPQQVAVQEDSADVSEVDQGLIVHQVLTYRVLPGVCSNAAAQAQLSSAGIGCFTRPSVAQRAAAFSNASDPHFVADIAKRGEAVAASQSVSAATQADAAKHIADLRKQLADSSQRAAISAQIGAEETERMSSMSDDELEGEILNSATQHFEETTFLPRVASSNYAHPALALRSSASSAEVAAGEGLMDGSLTPASAGSQFPKLLRPVPTSAYRSLSGAAAGGGDQVTDLDLGTYIFLTGFTLGHDYEWNLSVSTTINWCIIGCSSTYSVTLYAGFNYGFGLRFPIQTQLSYHNDVHSNNTADADVKAVFKPIEGTAADFTSTGLSDDQLFDGKELVAQVGADAGFSYNLPVVGSNSMGITVGVDFTNLLPAPYTGGHFEPPAPGTHGIDTPYIFNTIDLLGGLLNFGAVGGQVFPAVDINLHSDKLQFTVEDELLKRQTRVTTTGQTIPLGTNSGSNDDSHFSFGSPVYNLGFTLTPGIDARLFIDLGVWSHTWDWPVWFPQLAVDLPPNGIDFSCHAGTTCVLDFQPEHEAGLSSGLLAQLAAEGCTRQGSTMNCTTLQGYQACQSAVTSNSLLGVQTCNPGMALSVAAAADRTLLGGGCQRNGGRSGEYLCPMQGGMLNLCTTMLKNGAVLSCGILVPASTDEILKRGGCVADPGKPGNYSCPASMLGLCQLYVKNGVLLACQKQ
jgi:hypothetical protein